MSFILDSTLTRFFTRIAPVRPDRGLVVAFSGGPDSTALLAALVRLAHSPGPLAGLRLIAAHLDHATDPGSTVRAAQARRLAERLGVGMVGTRRPVFERARPGESPEAAGRRVRYEFLEEVRRAADARWVATAHHRDDQAETVLLRLLQGTGPEGLAGIRPVHGHVARPLLTTGRGALLATLPSAGLDPERDPVRDPTNRDRSIPRNRVRHELLPLLSADLAAAHRGGAEAAHQELRARLAALARAAAGARDRLERTLEGRLAPETLDDGPGVAIAVSDLEDLPAALLPHALAYLHRRAGAPYPAGTAAAEELARQLAKRTAPRADDPSERSVERAVGCDAGGGWRWTVRGERLLLLAPSARRASRPQMVSYTLEAPGEVRIPELGVTLRVRRAPVAPWMFRGESDRAGLALPRGPEAGRLLVRTRRPGDRLQPLGAPGARKLKDVLIDRRIPRERRDRLPLLCLGDRIAWVPGVTVDEAFRIPPGAETAWIAEVAP